MNEVERTALERNLAQLDYRAIDHALGQQPTADLIAMLDSKRRKIGDAAATLLYRRRECASVASALSEDHLSTARGRVRALFVLHCFGAACPDALQAYHKCVSDNHPDVLGDALFGLVFLRDKLVLPRLHNRLAETPSTSPAHLLLQKAIAAIEKNDPYIYSPNYGGGEKWGVKRV